VRRLSIVARAGIANLFGGKSGEVGVRRAAFDEDEEDNPTRVRSRLKLERRESGGRGEELSRVLDMAVSNIPGDVSSSGKTGDL
jgi:UV DNA damage repair endonuclease